MLVNQMSPTSTRPSYPVPRHIHTGIRKTGGLELIPSLCYPVLFAMYVGIVSKATYFNC